MHRLWYEGITDREIRPLRLIPAKHLHPRDKKNASRARGIIQELEKYIDHTYWNEDQSIRDRMFNHAFDKFTQSFESVGQKKRKISEDHLRNISYTTLYEKYLLPLHRFHSR